MRAPSPLAKNTSWTLRMSCKHSSLSSRHCRLYTSVRTIAKNTWLGRLLYVCWTERTDSTILLSHNCHWKCGSNTFCPELIVLPTYVCPGDSGLPRYTLPIHWLDPSSLPRSPRPQRQRERELLPQPRANPVPYLPYRYNTTVQYLFFMRTGLKQVYLVLYQLRKVKLRCTTRVREPYTPQKETTFSAHSFAVHVMNRFQVQTKAYYYYTRAVHTPERKY